ncbi:EAL domain-containing protein [Rhizobium sp. LjRoot30]|uniref:bifunctional diguanylate cyclase/phosphodiesterase n=1 Tax=Rhizobium sp. LjRoot30 TaxID=3342320 RepID=UPI003ECF5144
MSVVAAILVAAMVMTLGFVLDQQNQAFYLREMHIRTDNDAALIHARMMGQINTDFALVRNLSNTISAAGEIRPELDTQIERLLLQNPHLSSIAFAPGFIVEKVFPAGEGRSRIGQDVRGAQLLRPSDARNSDRFAAKFYGPVSTASGAGGFVILYPVVSSEQGSHKLWGAIEAVIDENKFYEATGLSPVRNSENQERYPHLDRLSLAVRDLSLPAANNTPFFGDAAVLDKEPVRRKIGFPGGTWELAAVPSVGWDAPPPNQTFLRVAIFLAGGIIIFPVFMSSLLIFERSQNVKTLERRETQLSELSQRLDLALETSQIGIWEMGSDGAQLFWDDRAAQLHGHLPSDHGYKLADWIAVVHPDDRPAAEAHFFNCSIVGNTASVQYRVIFDNGFERYLRSVGSHYRGASGTQTIGIVWDVTGDVLMNDDLRHAKETSDLKNAELELALMELSSREQLLEELSRKLSLALDSYRCGIWEVDLATDTEIWDDRMHQLYGLPYSTEPMTSERWHSLIHPEDRAAAKASETEFTNHDMSEPLVVRAIHPDGSLHYIRSIGKLHTGKDGSRRIIGIAFDITTDALLTEELKSAKAEADMRNIELQFAKSCIEHNSLHDPLTMLGNRRKLDVELDMLSRLSAEQPQKLSLLHIDLDRFKQINDTLGHAAGDAMLAHAAKILEANIRQNDLVARIGGDEFVIVVRDSCDPEKMAALAGRILEEMRQPVTFDGVSCRCGVSIGIAHGDGMNIDTRQLLVNADIALYRAKATGRNCYEFFTQNLQAEIITTKRIADEILAGLENDEFTAWYQPQFCAKTMELTGVEALVRWNHPTKGVLTPDRFLKIADELNVVPMLDRIVLEKALQDKMRWASRGIVVPKVSVNVSSRRLNDEALFETLTALAIVPGEISFELIESIFLDESDTIVSHNLERIKSLGIDIEIDDFGTGHTSIVSLLKLRPKRLKIDRQLVQPILESQQERALVRSIIEIAHSLGVDTVAEGVESFEHATMLRQLGCDLLQGYAFSKPRSFEDFCTMVQAAEWRKVS